MVKSIVDYYQPKECDVICARGKTFSCHLGNEVFLKVVRANLKQYLQANGRFERTLIVSHMAANFRECGVKFARLAEVPSGANSKKKAICFSDLILYRFSEINDERKIHEKIGHAFRDMVRAQGFRDGASTKADQVHMKQPSQSFERKSPSTLLGRLSRRGKRNMKGKNSNNQGERDDEKTHSNLLRPNAHQPSDKESNNPMLPSAHSPQIDDTPCDSTQDELDPDLPTMEMEQLDMDPAEWQKFTDIDFDMSSHAALLAVGSYTDEEHPECCHQDKDQDDDDEASIVSSPALVFQCLEDDFQELCGVSVNDLSPEGLLEWSDPKCIGSTEENTPPPSCTNTTIEAHPDANEIPSTALPETQQDYDMHSDSTGCRFNDILDTELPCGTPWEELMFQQDNCEEEHFDFWTSDESHS